MTAQTYKCPSCGSPLHFDGQSLEMTCSACGNTFSHQVLEDIRDIAVENRDDIQSTWQSSDTAFDHAESTQMQSFSCSSCGAELITEKTTVATNCAFCGSPNILPTQLDKATRPSRIAPFLITKDQAVAIFDGYFKGKRLLPNIFHGNNMIDEIRQLYVPYWVFGARTHADISYRATQTHSYRSGDYQITKTRHFLIHRAGTLDFSNMPIDASARFDNALSESLEPFRLEDAIPFHPATLAGALADKPDVSPETCKQRADERIQQSVKAAFRSTVMGYNSVIPLSQNIRIPNGTQESVLLPIWHITTTKEGKQYTFAVNGQTGETTCNLPYSKGKYLLWLLGTALGATAAGAAILYFLISGGVIA